MRVRRGLGREEVGGEFRGGRAEEGWVTGFKAVLVGLGFGASSVCTACLSSLAPPYSVCWFLFVLFLVSSFYSFFLSCRSPDSWCRWCNVDNASLKSERCLNRF